MGMQLFLKIWWVLSIRHSGNPCRLSLAFTSSCHIEIQIQSAGFWGNVVSRGRLPDTTRMAEFKRGNNEEVV